MSSFYVYRLISKSKNTVMYIGVTKCKRCNGIINIDNFRYNVSQGSAFKLSERKAWHILARNLRNMQKRYRKYGRKFKRRFRLRNRYRRRRRLLAAKQKRRFYRRRVIHRNYATRRSGANFGKRGGSNGVIVTLKHSQYYKFQDIVTSHSNVTIPFRVLDFSNNCFLSERNVDPIIKCYFSKYLFVKPLSITIRLDRWSWTEYISNGNNEVDIKQKRVFPLYYKWDLYNKEPGTNDATGVKQRLQ